MLIFCLIVSIRQQALADHLYGVDLSYENLGGFKYRVSLVVYGDCSGSKYPLLQGASPKVMVQNKGALVTTITLSQSGPGVEVTPVCVAQQPNTACKNPSYTIPGVTRYVYTSTYTLPDTSSGWVFRFDGELPSPNVPGQKAGRSLGISNIVGGTWTALEATLNNTTGQNSSPQFSTIPTPFYCINSSIQHNSGAVDIDHDSLTYSLVRGLISSQMGGGYVTYYPPYSGTAPLATGPGAFSFNPNTGQLNFVANSLQRSLVVQQVNEYRNGIQVGSASREMTFIVLSNCNNTPAIAFIDTSRTAGTYGGVVADHHTFNVCQGVDSLRFGIVPENPNGDTLTASVSGLPPGAVANVSFDHTQRPLVAVEWKAASAGPGVYNFYVTYKDNACPLSGQQTQVFSINLIRPSQVRATIVSPTQCVHRSAVDLKFSYGSLPRTVTVSKSGTPLTNYIDSTGTIRDSLWAGNYTVTVASPDLACATTYSFVVPDSGTYPNQPRAVESNLFYCSYDKANQLSVIADSGAVIKWYDNSLAPLFGTPTPRTDTWGIFTWYYSQKFKSCESEIDSIKVFVTKRPVASIAAPDAVCINDTAFISFDGIVGEGPIINYNWDWSYPDFLSGSDSSWRVHWNSPGEKKVTLVVEENKCISLPARKLINVRRPVYAGFDVRNSVCLFDTLQVRYNSTPKPSQRFEWNFTNVDSAFEISAEVFSLSWNKPGSKKISLTVYSDGCSDSREAVITVHPLPEVQIVNRTTPVCIGDKIFLLATGGAKYTWMPRDSLLFDVDGRLYVQILRPSIYRVTASSEFGCEDSAAIAYNTVDACCDFSYPNAFTPNGDGRNDRFRIVTYGNCRQFELSIYNRWGQRVYYGLDPNEGWDGSFHGSSSDAGTYFYHLSATCFTGHQEIRNGELILIN